MSLNRESDGSMPGVDLQQREVRIRTGVIETLGRDQDIAVLVREHADIDLIEVVYVTMILAPMQEIT